MKTSPFTRVVVVLLMSISLGCIDVGSLKEPTGRGGGGGSTGAGGAAGTTGAGGAAGITGRGGTTGTAGRGGTTGTAGRGGTGGQAGGSGATGARCAWDAAFGAAVPLNDVNLVGFYDFSMDLSPDELVADFVSSRPQTAGLPTSHNIWTVSRASRNDPFGPATLLPGAHLTGGYAYTVTLTADRLTLLVATDPTVVYIATRKSLGDAFDPPTLALRDAEGPWIRDDGGRVYFNSWPNRDIVMADRVGQGFAAAVPVPGVNSTADDTNPVLSPDELTIYFVSNRLGIGHAWMAHRDSTSAAFGAPVSLAHLRAAPSWVSPDGCRLYLSQATADGFLDVYVATRDAVSTSIPLPPDENGRYDGSNAAGVVGAWWSGGDYYGMDKAAGTGDCTMAGFPASACSVLSTPTPGLPFQPDPGGRGMCTSGIAARVLNDSTGAPAWSAIWGDIIGFTLNSAGDLSDWITTWGQYDAVAHGVTGVAFDIDAVPIGGHMRVGFQTPGTEYNYAYWQGSSMDLSPLQSPGHYEIRWPEVGGPYFLQNPPPFDPTRLESIMFSVVSNAVAPVPFNFCISNVQLLTN